MLDKILLQLKSDYKQLGLGDDILKIYAKRIAVEVKEEEQITQAVAQAGLLEELKALQKAMDKQRGEWVQSKPSAPAVEPAPPVPAVVETPPLPAVETIPAWAKSLLEHQQHLHQSLEGLQKEQIQKNNQALLLGKLKEAEVAQAFYQHHLDRDFSDTQQMDTLVADLKQSQVDFLQKVNADSLKGHGAPSAGLGNLSVESVSPSTERFLASLTKAQPVQAITPAGQAI